jgi:hypothetical protein
MITLFFEINGQFRKYTCLNYQLINGFYIFTDTFDGKQRKLSKEYYKGEERIE